MMTEIAQRFLCLDCGYDTSSVAGGEYFMVHDHAWPLEYDAGMLCVGCLEQRLGRQLTRDDFTDVPVNSLGWGHKSDRLKERMLVRPNIHV